MMRGKNTEKLCVSFFCLTIFFLNIVTPSVAETTATYTEPTTGMEFVLVLGGSFIMGNDSERHANPEHKVAVQTFYLARYEVTFAEFDLYCQETGETCPNDNGWGRDRRPVINVSWNDAVAYTSWLSKKAGRNFRLPTEAEWEYAAQGGTHTDYPWGNAVGRNNANCRDCDIANGGKTTTVGSFPPNEYELYDMAGNVYEWCLDSASEGKDGAPIDGSPYLEGNHEKKVTRSGSWSRIHREIRTFQRCWDPATTRNDEIGFRVLMEL